LEGIGTILGNIAAGVQNPFDSVLKSVGDILGNGLIQVGEKLIGASAIMKTINTAIKSLGSTFGPEAGVIAGIAAIAAGTLIKAEVSKITTHAFADGGFVFGPTLSLTGEAGPEMILPLSKAPQILGAMQGAGNMKVTVDGRLDGNNIALSQKRNAKLQNQV
jgi:hypothetical protein